MKRISLIILTLCFFNISFSQKADLTSAILAFQKNDLSAAKKWIDVASNKIKEGQVLKPKVASKFYYYRGVIYLKHFQLAISDPAIDLNFDYLDEATAAFSLDSGLESSFSKKSIIELNRCAYLYVDYAYKDYENKDFNSAEDKFNKAININSLPAISKIDTVNIYNASIMSFSSGNYEKSLEWSKQLVKLNPLDLRYHIQLIDNYSELGDLENQLISIKNARDILPKSQDIIFKEVNYYLTTGENTLLEKSLETAILADSTNPVLFFALGSTYAQLGNIESSEISYLSAIRLKPDYFDAYNNLASLYLDQTIPLIEKKNALNYNQEKQFNRLNKEIDALYFKTIPYLEKALFIQPSNNAIANALKEIYYKVDDFDKMKQVKKLLELTGEERVTYVKEILD